MATVALKSTHANTSAFAKSANDTCCQGRLDHGSSTGDIATNVDSQPSFPLLLAELAAMVVGSAKGTVPITLAIPCVVE